MTLSVADKYLQLLDRQYYNSYGKVVKVVGLTIESVGPKARLGDLCKIYPDEDRENHVIAEVVGFHDSKLILMPVDSVEGVGVGCIVENTGHPLSVLVGEELLGRIPGIDVPHAARIVGQVARGAEKDSRHVHELGEGEVDQKYADQRQVREEQGIDAGGSHRCKMDEPHDEDSDLGDLGLVKIAQADARAHDGNEQPEGEIVVGQGQIAQTLVEDAPPQQKEQGHQHQTAGHEEAGRTHLHDAVNAFEKADTGGHRLHEETEMADENQQKTVVKKKREGPEPFGGIIDGPGAVADGVVLQRFRMRVAEQRTEKKNLQEHALQHAPGGAGAVHLVLPDKVQRLLLPAGGGDAEGHGGFGPVNHAPYDAGKKNDHCRIGERNAEQTGKPDGRSRPGNGSYEQHQQQ